MSRQITNLLYDMMDEGIIDPRAIAEACLSYMSERDVADMAHCNEFILDDENED